MSALHAQLTAKLDEIEREAGSIQMQTPFVTWTSVCTCGTSGLSGYGHEPGCGAEPGDAWWVIESLRRGIAEDRSILLAHAPCSDGCAGHTVPMSCHRCDLPNYRRGYGQVGCSWQMSLARRHGIEVKP